MQRQAIMTVRQRLCAGWKMAGGELHEWPRRCSQIGEITPVFQLRQFDACRFIRNRIAGGIPASLTFFHCPRSRLRRSRDVQSATFLFVPPKVSRSKPREKHKAGSIGRLSDLTRVLAGFTCCRPPRDSILCKGRTFIIAHYRIG